MTPDRTRTKARIATAAATALLAVAACAASAGTASAGTATAGEGTAGPTAKECEYSNARPTLQLGDTGPAVKQAQCYLLHTLIIDDMIEVSGNFDAKTRMRVRQFQNCAGLPVNGVVGQSTWSVFQDWFSSGRVC